MILTDSKISDSKPGFFVEFGSFFTISPIISGFQTTRTGPETGASPFSTNFFSNIWQFSTPYVIIKEEVEVIPLKKKYSLDFSIQRDSDRLRAVQEILDTLDTDPTATELEQMASYILYGKDENG